MQNAIATVLMTGLTAESSVETRMRSPFARAITRNGRSARKMRKMRRILRAPRAMFWPLLE
eukprot:1976887-Rhodomonas_salina.2